MVLKCLLDFARTSSSTQSTSQTLLASPHLCCDLVLSPCVNKLWLTLRCPAGGNVGDQARCTALLFMSFLICSELVPDFADSALSALAASLSTPGAKFWARQPRDSADALERCLRCGSRVLLRGSITPPSTGLSDFASIVRPNLLESSLVPRISAAVGDFFSELLRLCPGATTLETAIQIFPVLQRPHLPAHESVVRCLQEAVRTAESCVLRSAASPHYDKNFSVPNIKRPKLTDVVNGGLHQQMCQQAERSTVTNVSRRLINMLHDALQAAVAIPKTIAAGRPWLPDYDIILLISSIIRIQLARYQLFDWQRILGPFGMLLTAVIQHTPHGITLEDSPDSVEYPTEAFAQFWLVATKVLADLVSGLTPLILEVHQRNFTQFLAVSLRDNFRRAGGCSKLGRRHREAAAKLVCLSLRALAVPHHTGQSKLAYKTLCSFLRPERSWQHSACMVIEAVKVCPHVAKTASNVVEIFSKLAEILQSTIVPQADNASVLFSLQIAIGQSVGPLCCLLAEFTTGAGPINAQDRKALPSWRCCRQCDMNTRSVACRLPIAQHLQRFDSLLDDRTSERATEAFVHSVRRALRHASREDLRNSIGNGFVKRWLQLLSHPRAKIRQVMVSSVGVLMDDQCVCISAVSAPR
eukprot:SAG11_NODE_304_length_10999_cov_3.121376_2_plen_640_part_00